MNVKSIVYVSLFDSQKLKAYVFEVPNPKALVVLLHGIAEHQGRYKALALRLNESGFNVLTIDQRGHGESLYDGILKGYFSDKDGWQRNLADINAVIHRVNDKNQLPVILFGHSMGSIVARSYLKYYGSDLRALYLSGSPDQSPLASFGVVVAKVLSIIQGKKHPSAIFTKLSFGKFNARIINPKTPFDWLSVNEENVQSYIQDPLCGFNSTTKLASDFLSAIDDVYRSKNWEIYNPKLPIRFVSGRLDPSYKPNGIERAAKKVQELGYQNVDFHYVEGCRHDIFHEIFREEVTNSFIDWCNQSLVH